MPAFRIAIVAFAAALIMPQAFGEPSGTLAHCCNRDQPNIQCSSSDTHGGEEHSNCRTEYKPGNGKIDICERRVISNGVEIYFGDAGEHPGDEDVLAGGVTCASGDFLDVTVLAPSAGSAIEFSPGGRGLIYTTSSGGSCSVTCYNPSGSGSACSSAQVSGIIH